MIRNGGGVASDPSEKEGPCGHIVVCVWHGA
jgi:hypothetical protein